MQTSKDISLCCFKSGCVDTWRADDNAADETDDHRSLPCRTLLDGQDCIFANESSQKIDMAIQFTAIYDRT